MRTVTLRVIAATCELVASFSRSFPVIDASTPSTERKLRLSLPFEFVTSLPVSDGDRSRVPCTMTSNSFAGFVAASARRLSGTNADAFPGPELIDDALPATGTTNIAASASMIMPRLPLPQSAFERDSPRRPQSAFARTPLPILRSCRM